MTETEGASEREGVSRCCLRVPGDIEIANCSYSHARAPPCNLLLLRLEPVRERDGRVFPSPIRQAVICTANNIKLLSPAAE